MESIVLELEVDEGLARAWRNSSPELRLSYENKIADLLRELQKAEFDNLLDRAGEIAKNNGLTEEELDSILKEDAVEDGEPYEWWNDEEMMAELDRRSADLRSGKVKGVSLEESKAYLLSRLKRNEL
jgi:hypothetical protein